MCGGWGGGLNIVTVPNSADIKTHILFSSCRGFLSNTMYHGIKLTYYEEAKKKELLKTVRAYETP